jgi:hypothetical protein
MVSRAKVFVGLPTRHFEQVLPELFFRVGIHQHVLRGIVHAAQVAGMARIAATPLTRRCLQQLHAGAHLGSHEGRTQGGVAAADHQHIGVHEKPVSSDVGARFFQLPIVLINEYQVIIIAF